MGDPLSPAMCIGTCAHMEMRWMKDLQTKDKRRFMAARFMDDILLISTTFGEEQERLIDQLRDCYSEPLSLEGGAEGVFLETQFRVMGDYIAYRLKNVNSGTDRKVWRYHDFDSYVPYIQKKSTMIATLKKVQNMAGSKNELWESAEDKLREFARIGYPMRVRRYVCYRMYKETGDETWVGVATRQN